MRFHSILAGTAAIFFSVTPLFSGIALISQERIISARVEAFATPDKPNGDTKEETLSAFGFETFDESVDVELIGAATTHEPAQPFSAHSAMTSFFIATNDGWSIFTDGTMGRNDEPENAKSASAHAKYDLSFAIDSSYKFSWEVFSEGEGIHPILRDEDGNDVLPTVEGLLLPGTYSIEMDLQPPFVSLGSFGSYNFELVATNPIPLPPGAYSAFAILGVLAVLQYRRVTAVHGAIQRRTTRRCSGSSRRVRFL